MIITDKAQIKCYELIESDLKLPADATFTRSSVAYLSDGTQVPANTPRFEAGKFGKAIMVEEGTTNLLNNPTFKGESGVASCFTAYGSGVNYEIVNDGYLPNTLSQRLYYISPTGDDSQMNKGIRFRFNITGQIGDVFTITFYGKGWEEHDNISTYWSAARQLSLEKEQLEGGWTKYTHIIQLTDTATTYYIRPNGNKEYSFDCLINAPQLEAKPYPTSFIDGTRSPETLTIPTAGVLNPQEGTIEFWVKKSAPSRVTGNCFFATTGTKRWDAWFDVGGKILFGLYNENSNNENSDGWLYASISGTFPLNSWQHIAITWNSSGQRLYYNGQLVGVNTSTPIDFGNTIYIGSYKSTGYESNTLIDDLRISNRARTDAEILAAYQSGKPLLADEWTTYKLDFDDKVRITAQGQIICNEFIEI